MARSQTTYVAAQGRRYRLGRTKTYGGIWRKRPWGWHLVSRYPLTDDGWRIASEQFSIWEPGAHLVGEDQVATRGWWPPGWQLAIVAVAVLLVAAGGVYLGTTSPTSSRSRPLAGGSPATTLAPVGEGYLASGNGYVDFIQWNDNNGRLSGTAQTVTTKGQPPNMSTSSNTLSLTGTLSDLSISISFSGDPTTSGTMAGGSFVLNFPQTNGTLAPVTFASASARQFNVAVNSLSQQVAQANQSEANAQALQQEQQKIGNDAASVNSDISGLADRSLFSDDRRSVS